jgi:hypothetical protein
MDEHRCGAGRLLTVVGDEAVPARPAHRRGDRTDHLGRHAVRLDDDGTEVVRVFGADLLDAKLGSGFVRLDAAAEDRPGVPRLEPALLEQARESFGRRADRDLVPRPGLAKERVDLVEVVVGRPPLETEPESPVHHQHVREPLHGSADRSGDLEPRPAGLLLEQPVEVAEGYELGALSGIAQGSGC